MKGIWVIVIMILVIGFSFLTVSPKVGTSIIELIINASALVMIAVVTSIIKYFYDKKIGESVNEV